MRCSSRGFVTSSRLRILFDFAARSASSPRRQKRTGLSASAFASLYHYPMPGEVAAAHRDIPLYEPVPFELFRFEYHWIQKTALISISGESNNWQPTACHWEARTSVVAHELC
jgi:hypothetical protein